MNKSAWSILSLWGITLFLNYLKVSIHPDWLDAVWALILLVLTSAFVWTLRKNFNKIYLFLLVSVALFMLVMPMERLYRPLKVYDFDSNFRVKAYLETTGFSDAGTRFDLYQKLSVLPVLEKFVGTAINWGTDYVSGKPDPEIHLTETAVTVSRGGVSDTIIIHWEKYSF